MSRIGLIILIVISYCIINQEEIKQIKIPEDFKIKLTSKAVSELGLEIFVSSSKDLVKFNLITPLIDIIDFNLFDFKNSSFYMSIGKFKKVLRLNNKKMIRLRTFIGAFEFMMSGPEVNEEGNSFFNFPLLFPEQYQAKLILNSEGKFSEIRFNYLNITFFTDGFEPLNDSIIDFPIPEKCNEVSSEELNSYWEALRGMITGALGKDNLISTLFENYIGSSTNNDYKSRYSQKMENKMKWSSENHTAEKSKNKVNEL